MVSSLHLMHTDRNQSANSSMHSIRLCMISIMLSAYQNTSYQFIISIASGYLPFPLSSSSKGNVYVNEITQFRTKITDWCFNDFNSSEILIRSLISFALLPDRLWYYFIQTAPSTSTSTTTSTRRWKHYKGFTAKADVTLNQEKTAIHVSDSIV